MVKRHLKLKTGTFYYLFEKSSLLYRNYYVKMTRLTICTTWKNPNQNFGPDQDYYREKKVLFLPRLFCSIYLH